MDFFSLTYFLEERNEPWFYRGIDDSFVNMRRLPSFISELSEQFDPLSDLVLRGDCVVSNGVRFIQGGSGFLCSRAAARRLNNISEFLRLWSGAEDVTMARLIDAVGIGVRESCSGAFMGHGPDFLDEAANAERCPPMNVSRMPVPHHLERVRDLLVYHKQEESGRNLQEALPWAKWVFEAPESLRWFVRDDNFWPGTCTYTGEPRANRHMGRIEMELTRIRKAGPPKGMRFWIWRGSNKER
jgi:hypothetical protein